MIAAKADIGLKKYETLPFYRNNELLGYSLRTVDSTKRKIPVEPVYISAGNLITSEETLKIMKNCIGNYRIPEPTRLAHEKVNLFRTGKLKAGFHLENQEWTLF